MDHPVAHLVDRLEAHQVDHGHLKIAMKADILVPEYLEDSQDSYLEVQVGHLEDLLGVHPVHLVLGDRLLMSMAGIDLALEVHHWNYWVNHIQDILMILDGLMDNLRFVDNPAKKMILQI